MHCPFLSHTILYCIVLSSTMSSPLTRLMQMLSSRIVWNCVALYYNVQLCCNITLLVVLYQLVSFCSVPYHLVSYCTVQYCTVVYGMGTLAICTVPEHASTLESSSSFSSSALSHIFELEFARFIASKCSILSYLSKPYHGFQTHPVWYRNVSYRILSHHHHVVSYFTVMTFIKVYAGLIFGACPNS